MTSAQLWRAVSDQAAAWAETPTVRRFARDLPRNAAGRPKGLPELLQRAQAGAGFIDAQPLRLATLLPLAAQASEDIDAKAMEADHGDWLAATTRVESAHRATIAWLRARLPGYPALPAPQLTPGSPLRTHEFTHRLVWTPGERGLGLQFEDPRPEIARALGADEAQRRRLDETAREVAAALAASAEWQRLDAATGALDEEARAALSELRTALRDRLAPEMVDYYEPTMALRRAGYRKAVVDQAVATLTGTAAEYAAAFEAADLLVEVAASDVFAQLACYRSPTLRPRDLEVHDGVPVRVTFTLDEAGPVVPESGMLAWLDNPQVPDAVLLTGVALRWDGARTTRDVRSTVLAGSAEAWRPDTP